jgi:hypothetical protein
MERVRRAALFQESLLLPKRLPLLLLVIHVFVGAKYICSVLNRPMIKKGYPVGYSDFRK